MAMTKRYLGLIIGCAVTIALIGCGEKEFAIAPVSGQVTLNGKPVEGARVRFQPISQSADIEVGGGSYATTDAAGNYTLQLVLQEGEGAVVGKHRVTISTGTSVANSDESTIIGERAAPRWLAGNEEFEVPADGTTEANFEIGK